MLNIAVIGAGRIGRIHAANIAANPAARLAGVTDVDAAAAEALAGPCGAHAVTLDAAFAADAVLIASPTPTKNQETGSPTPAICSATVFPRSTKSPRRTSRI